MSKINMKNNTKCPKTLSGKHLWPDKYSFDNANLMYKIDPEKSLLMLGKIIYSGHVICQACGMIDDTKSIKYEK